MHDRRKHARQVAGRHMTEPLHEEKSTSTMVSLVDSIRLGFLAIQMMDLVCLSRDINSA